MKKGLWICVVLTLVLLMGLWFWQYERTQKDFEPYLMPSETVYHAMGEWIAIGPSTAGKMTDADGYCIRVNGRQLTDYAAYIQENAIDDPLKKDGVQLSIPHKLMVVSVTLKNEDAKNAFNLFDLGLRGVGVKESFHRELLLALNPELKDAVIKPALGDECTVLLPFGLYRDRFSHQSWSRLEEFPLYVEFREITQKERKNWIAVQ